MMPTSRQIWDLWYPDAAAQGLPFARGRLDATDIVLVDAAPETLESRYGATMAACWTGKGLRRLAQRPMARLTRPRRWHRARGSLARGRDLGRPVILPGGEVGILLAWWNADDGSEWRWQVEFYNHR